MDEEKTCRCNDECCERPEPQLGGVAGEALTYAPDYQGNTLTFNNASGEPCVGTNNRIHDTVIKQMDYGYLVKAGCQTLCISKKEHLLMLFEAYLNDPRKVWEAHAKGKIEDILTDKTVEKFKRDEPKEKFEVHFGIVGKSLKDINDYMLMMLGGAYRRKNSEYVVETKEADLIYHPITTVGHTNGLALNKIIETHSARENRDFSVIIEACQVSLKSKS